jgi:soluble lytic murein transglycosylase
VSAAVRRRRRTALALIVGGLIAGIGIALWFGPGEEALREITLPLRHEDIIRQQARDKDLDPALIAGVIYTESRFRDQTSEAGAKGLMQILPSTADYIARKSGGTAFEQGDLASPQINIAYGSFYLRYLMDKYDENEILALAAYNGGEGAVDGWVSRAAAAGERFRVSTHIPFPETREYVGRVLTARDTYRREYRRELGL